MSGALTAGEIEQTIRAVRDQCGWPEPKAGHEFCEMFGCFEFRRWVVTLAERDARLAALERKLDTYRRMHHEACELAMQAAQERDAARALLAPAGRAAGAGWRTHRCSKCGEPCYGPVCPDEQPECYACHIKPAPQPDAGGERSE